MVHVGKIQLEEITWWLFSWTGGKTCHFNQMSMSKLLNEFHRKKGEDTLPETNIAPQKWMVGNVGRCISFWDGLFSGANCQFQGGYLKIWHFSLGSLGRTDLSDLSQRKIHGLLVGQCAFLLHFPIWQCDKFPSHFKGSVWLNYKVPCGTNPQMPERHSLRSCDAKFRNPGFMDLINNCSEDSSFCFTWQNLDLTIQLGIISTPVVKNKISLDA